MYGVLMNLISTIMTGTGLALLLVGVIGLIVIGPEECEEEKDNGDTV